MSYEYDFVFDWTMLKQGISSTTNNATNNATKEPAQPAASSCLATAQYPSVKWETQENSMLCPTTISLNLFKLEINS